MKSKGGTGAFKEGRGGRKQKEEEEERAKQEAANILKDSLCSFVSSGTNSDPVGLSALSPEEIYHEMTDLHSKRLGIDHTDLHLWQSIAELGALIMDEDVLYVLQNLKEMGMEMCKSRRSLFEQDRKDTDQIIIGSNASSVNSPVLGTVHIKQEKDVQNGMQMRSNSALRSPPAQLLQGMKCHNEETFSETMLGGKRRKTGSMPSCSRTPGSTPNRIPASSDECVSQADIKCKKADQGNAFLHTKKITKSNNPLVFNSVREKGRYIVQFTCGDDSFYKIMTYYYPALSMTPEDVHFKELKKMLFTFIMKNYDYTQVQIFLSSASFYADYFWHILSKPHFLNNSFMSHFRCGQLALWTNQTRHSGTGLMK